jgi:hypothetical protein
MDLSTRESSTFPSFMYDRDINVFAPDSNCIESRRLMQYSGGLSLAQPCVVM